MPRHKLIDQYGDPKELLDDILSRKGGYEFLQDLMSYLSERLDEEAEKYRKRQDFSKKIEETAKKLRHVLCDLEELSQDLDPR